MRWTYYYYNAQICAQTQNRRNIRIAECSFRAYSSIFGLTVIAKLDTDVRINVGTG